MIDFQEVERQLPAYLNYDGKKKLFSDLTQFPDNIDERLYTTYLKAELCLFQGDGLKDMLFVDLPSLNKKEVDAMILSNSCDIDPKNEKFFPLNVVYAPIVSLQRYVDLLISQEVDKAKLEDHVNSIKRQEVSHIFYLPKVSSLKMFYPYHKVLLLIFFQGIIHQCFLICNSSFCMSALKM